MSIASFQLLAALLMLVLAAANADNFAVIVGSSKYWYNYRHESNALSIYSAVKRLGIPDSNIVLMIVDPLACNPRNNLPGTIFQDTGVSRRSVITDTTEIDYQGRDATVENFLRVLTGKHPPHTALNKRLNTRSSSKVLLYLTGHGHDEMFKFNDQQELLAVDFANALQQMHLTNRYGQMLVVFDTCQAASMFNDVKAPNIIGMSSSKLGQSSYAHLNDFDINVHLADQFTFFLSKFLITFNPSYNFTLADVYNYITEQGISSTVVSWASKKGGRGLHQAKVSEFFSRSTNFKFSGIQEMRM